MPVDQLRDALQAYWGYDTFRPLQREAMESVLRERDSLVVLPTGGGKSICFQAPAVAMDGMAIVLSPLIALMKDQVDALTECGVPAACIHSMLVASEKRDIDARIRSGELKLLYVSPERMAQQRFLDYLRAVKISFIAVDEAHCISMWGHDFRPEYRALRNLKTAFPGIAIHAYTATATPQVRADIINELGLHDPEVLVGSFNRPNLAYRVERANDRIAQIQDVVERHKGESGIVYCISRKETESVAARLCERGYRALPYHAGMADAQRHANQDAFARDEADIVVATVAFGMGIDKSNVRYVIHAAMPKSIEHYQQESGRAGRDGLEAECLLLYSGSDFMLWKRIIDDSEQEGKEVALGKLRAVDQYCKGMGCRRRTLLAYFHEHLEATNCQSCDVCMDTVEISPESERYAKLLLESVRDTGQRFGRTYIVQLLLGKVDERMQQLHHDQLPMVGALADQRAPVLGEWLDQLEGQGLLERGDYNVLGLTPLGRAYLRGEPEVDTPRLAKPGLKPGRGSRSRVERDAWEGVNEGLFETLRALRRELAEAKNKPAYVIFGDAALRDMARVRPSTPESFLAVRGVGRQKADAYGELFLKAIVEQCIARGLDTDVGVPVGVGIEPSFEMPPESAGSARRVKPERGDGRSMAMQLFAKGRSIEEVVEATQRAQSTVGGYLIEYLREHEVEDPAPWLDLATFERIVCAAEELNAERLKPLFEHFGGEIDYNTLRIAMTCLSNCKGPGGIMPKPGSELPLPPVSPPPSTAHEEEAPYEVTPAPTPPKPAPKPAARKFTPVEQTAIDRLAAGEKPEAIAESMGQTVAWAYSLLAEHVVRSGATNPFLWIDKMLYLQIASAAAQADTFDTQKVVAATGGTVPHGPASVALACLRNRQGTG
jgi:ATP-dependent DNA helicase RecQ